MRSLPDTSTHEQQWGFNHRILILSPICYTLIHVFLLIIYMLGYMKKILVFILVSGAPSVLLNINDTILFHKYFVLTCQRKSRFCAVIKMLKKNVSFVNFDWDPICRLYIYDLTYRCVSKFYSPIHSSQNAPLYMEASPKFALYLYQILDGFMGSYRPIKR